MDALPVESDVCTDSDTGEEGVANSVQAPQMNTASGDENQNGCVTVTTEEDEEPHLGTPILDLNSKSTLYAERGCALANDFCLLCQTAVQEVSTSIGEHSEIRQLKAYARMIFRSTNSIDVTAECLQDYYNKKIRSAAKYKHPVTKVIYESPVWSKASIRRHFEYSDDFPDIKHALIGLTLQALCHRQSQFLVNADGTTHSTRTKEYLQTVKVLMDHTKLQHSIAMNMHNVRHKRIQRQRTRAKKTLAITM